MINVKIYGKKWNVYNCSNFPYNKLWKDNQLNYIDKGRGKDKYKIYNIITSFDTESTTILDKDRKEPQDYAFTYIWGFKIDKYIIVGRFYEEFQIFLTKLKNTFELHKKDKIIIYCHNLSYDFQFFYQFLQEMDPDNFSLFATNKRKVLKCNIEGFEFRCSLKLTNMSLERWGAKENGVIYKKLAGTMDYKKIIYPFDNLKRNDFRYFCADLISLYDCIDNKLKNDNMNLSNIPLTSTGYPRQDSKDYCRKDWHYRYYVNCMTLNESSYNMCQAVKVGGDTHSNRFYQGQIIEVPGFRSKDIKSSYPYQMLEGLAPVSNFMLYGDCNTKFDFRRCLDNFCCMFYIYFDYIRIKPYDPLSVISVSKIIKYDSIDIVDNGRLIEGKGIILALTEERYKHIKAHYDFTHIKVWNMWIAEKGRIPEAYRDYTYNLFKQKCELEKYKHTPKEWIYDKFKNLLNALYGMCLTDIVHEEIIINNINELPEWDSTQIKSVEEQIEKYNKQWDRHLYYPWGIWIVDNARTHLYDMIACCNDPCYWDTDSCKGFNWDMDKVNKYNDEVIAKLKRDNYQVIIGDKTYNIGIADDEGIYKSFKSLGAKKYAYVDSNDKLHITIAGVSKSGVDFVKDIKNFNVGLVFPSKYAGQCAKYNDEPIHQLEHKGKKFITASNIALVDSTYTLNACDDYLKRANFTLLEVIE